VGLAKVTAIAIADPGMLGDQGAGGGYPQPAMMKSAMRGGAAFDAMSAAPTLQLKPEEIAISSVVDARFSAS
jgi:hypothetical protein